MIKDNIPRQTLQDVDNMTRNFEGAYSRGDTTSSVSDTTPLSKTTSTLLAIVAVVAYSYLVMVGVA